MDGMVGAPPSVAKHAREEKKYVLGRANQACLSSKKRGRPNIATGKPVVGVLNGLLSKKTHTPAEYE
jgi:hypothetical protein